MSLIVSNIVGGVNEQNSIVNKCTDDYTIEMSTIASNVIIIISRKNIYFYIYKRKN